LICFASNNQVNDFAIQKDAYASSVVCGERNKFHPAIRLSEDFVMKGIPLGLSQLAHVSVYLQADRY
jgi:hypothetical protein